MINYMSLISDEANSRVLWGLTSLRGCLWALDSLKLPEPGFSQNHMSY